MTPTHVIRRKVVWDGGSVNKTASKEEQASMIKNRLPPVPRGSDQLTGANLVVHVHRLTAATSLFTLLNAIVEVCYENQHDTSNLLTSKHWNTMAHRLTEMEKAAASYHL